MIFLAKISGRSLIADPQRVTEPAGDEERGAFALALEEGVGATVVPIFTAPMRPAGMGAPAGTSRAGGSPRSRHSR
jgi:hypothetical protein